MVRVSTQARIFLVVYKPCRNAHAAATEPTCPLLRACRIVLHVSEKLWAKCVAAQESSACLVRFRNDMRFETLPFLGQGGLAATAAICAGLGLTWCNSAANRCLSDAECVEMQARERIRPSSIGRELRDVQRAAKFRRSRPANMVWP